MRRGWLKLHRVIRIWVEGHKGKQAPVIHNDLGKVDGKTAVSFTNLMELRFIAVFAGAGVKFLNTGDPERGPGGSEASASICHQDRL